MVGKVQLGPLSGARRGPQEVPGFVPSVPVAGPGGLGSPVEQLQQKLPPVREAQQFNIPPELQTEEDFAQAPPPPEAEPTRSAAEESMMADPTVMDQQAAESEGELLASPEDEPSLYEDEDAYNQRLETEKKRQSEDLKFKNYDYTTADSLFTALEPTGTSKTNSNTIHSVARDIGASLLSTSFGRTNTSSSLDSKIPSGADGIKSLQAMTGSESAVQVAGWGATTMAVLSQRMRSGKATEEDNTLAALLGGFDDTAGAGSIFATEQDIPGAEPGSDFASDGSVPLENFPTLLGTVMKKVAADPNGRTPTNYDPDFAGALLMKSGIDSGIFLVKPNSDGKMAAFLNPLRGRELRDASRAVAKSFARSNVGKSQIVPVTDDNKYVGERGQLRKTAKKNPDQVIPQEIEQATATLGKIPLSVVPEADFFRRYFVQQTINAMVTPDAEGNVVSTQFRDEMGAPVPEVGPVPKNNPASRYASLLKSDEGSIDPEGDTRQLALDKYRGLIRNHVNYDKNLQEGLPRFARHWTDATVNRVYNDSVDANLQGEKDARAVYGPPPKLMKLGKAEYHKKGISEQEANAFWDSLRNDTPADPELSFLMTAAHALLPLKNYNTDAMIGPWLLEQLTPEMLREWADMGNKLKNTIPGYDPATRKVNRQAMSQATQIAPGGNIQITPEAEEVLNDLFQSGKFKDDNWGFMLRNLMAVADYVNAKDNGLAAFTPRNTTAIDQNSAGRTFAALDTGDIDTLKRTGILWDVLDQAMNPATPGFTKTTMPYGNPRTYFADMALDRGIEDALGMEGGARDEYTNAVKSVFRKAFQNPSFAKDLAKKPLMTSDYGKPAMFHGDAADALLNDIRYSDFKDGLRNAIIANKNPNATDKDSREVLKNVIWKTLNAVLDYAASNAPKQAQRVANMLGGVLSVNGHYGEKAFVGSFANLETGSYATINLEDSAGNSIEHKVHEKEYKFHLAQAAKRKRNPEWKTGDDPSAKYMEPRPGTFQINGIGPWLGQYRESILTSGLVNHLNPKPDAKTSEMQWVQTVHDNAILDSFSFAKGLYAGNNIIAPQAMAYSPAAGVMESFQEITKKAINSARAEALVNKGKIGIGKNSDFPLFLVELDQEYSIIHSKQAKNEKLTDSEKKLYDILSNPASGYKPPNAMKANGAVDYSQDTRDDHEVTLQQFQGLLGAFTQKTNVVRLLNEWSNEGEIKKRKVLDRIKPLASKGKISFFN